MLSFFEIRIKYFDVGIKNQFSMTESTFRDIQFLEVLNWVRVHSQTEKCVKTISKPRDWKLKHARHVQVALEG